MVLNSSQYIIRSKFFYYLKIGSHHEIQGSKEINEDILVPPFVCKIKVLYFHYLKLTDLLVATENRFSSKGVSSAIVHNHPRSVGTVEIRSTDPFAAPIITRDFFENPDDIADIIEGNKRNLCCHNNMCYVVLSE